MGSCQVSLPTPHAPSCLLVVPMLLALAAVRCYLGNYGLYFCKVLFKVNSSLSLLDKVCLVHILVSWSG